MVIYDLKLYTNKSLTKLLYRTDSLYLIGRDMRDRVIQEENRRLEQFRLIQQVQSKEEEIKALKEGTKH